MLLKKYFSWMFVSFAGIVLGYCLGRLRPSLVSSTNNNPIKLYNQYKITKVDASCPIKGNVSKTGKIYHMPGGQFYDRITKPDQCFKTEAQAIAAGFKKSSR